MSPTATPGTAARQKGCCQALPRHLAGSTATTLGEVFKALGDPTRIQIVHLLKNAAEPVCICDLTATLDVSQPTISHHMAKLRDAGIVVSEKRGIWVFYQLNPRSDAIVRHVLGVVD